VYQHAMHSCIQPPPDDERCAAVMSLSSTHFLALLCTAEAVASSGSSSRKAPLAREAEKCNQASSRSHSSHTSTLPDSSRSLKGLPGGSSIGSVEFLDGLLQPDKLATGSQDDKEPLLPGLPAMGRGDVGEPLPAGSFTSGVRKRFHREQQQQ
jgi:hypothetical protein